MSLLGLPEFTNEVQHLLKGVLRWDAATSSYRWMTDAKIAHLQADGCSVGQIAAALDRSTSTISRELTRNRGREVGYKPSYAHEQSRARRWVGSRLERDPTLRRAVLKRLAQGWSPEQVAGHMARELGRKVISYESIYRFIYAQIARTKDYRWRHYCRAARANAACVVARAAARQPS